MTEREDSEYWIGTTSNIYGPASFIDLDQHEKAQMDSLRKWAEEEKKQNKSKDLVSMDARKETGYKESKGKLFYELDFNFITQMAQRMQHYKKDKYAPYNWKNPTNVEDLKQATFRHMIAVMNGEYEDDGREFGHLEAIADNVMMINYQLKNYSNQ